MLKNTICNFLEPWEINRIWTIFRTQPRWIYRAFTGDRHFWYYEAYRSLGYYSGVNERQWAEDVDPLWRSIHQRICDLAGPTFETWRFIINGQTQGQDSAVHSDFPASVQSAHTYMLYLNQQWDQSWGGATKFYPTDAEPYEILPEPGKLIAYDGRISHQGLSPLVPNVLRVTLAVQGKHA